MINYTTSNLWHGIVRFRLKETLILHGHQIGYYVCWYVRDRATDNTKFDTRVVALVVKLYQQQPDWRLKELLDHLGVHHDSRNN